MIFSGLLFFGICILPALQLKQIGFVIVAERYTYLPYFGLFLIAGLFAGIVADRLSILKYGRTVFLIFIAMVLALNAVISSVRCTVWRDGIVLFSDVIEKYPEKALGYAYRGFAYHNKNMPDKAMSDYETAISMGYRRPGLIHARAEIMYGFHPYSGIIRRFDHAIELNPDEGAGYYNRGNVKASDKFLDYRGSIQDFNKAEELGYAPCYLYYNRGNSRRNTRDFEGAIEDYTRAIGMNNEMAQAYNNRGIARLYMSDRRGACEDWEIASGLGDKDARKSIVLYCQTDK